MGADGVGTAYSGKAFIRRFVFWLYRTSQLLNPVKNKATVDALWVCFISTLGVSARFCAAEREVYIHIGVGFCVARSTGLGNAKAFVERDGQLVQTPALFSYMY